MERDEALKLVNEAADYVRKLDSALGAAGLVSVKVEDNGQDDPAVEIGGRYIVYPTESAQEWVLDHLVNDPGVRYHADGSGTPPSTDVVLVKECRSYSEAVHLALELDFKERLVAACENIGCEEWAREEAEFTGI